MCVMDAAVKEAAVPRFLREYPQMERAVCDHPALLGCADVDWSRIPGCPTGIPALLHGLLDEDVGPEARPVLENVLMNSVFHVSAVMPTMNAKWRCSGRTPITRNASGAGPPSPHTLPACARCWRRGSFRTD